MMLTELPASLQLHIMQCLTDGRDLVNLGQVCPQLGTLTEDRLLWRRLCQYHFTDRQVGASQERYRIGVGEFVTSAPAEPILTVQNR